ncbi:MAG: hypothetical protein HYY17_02900 [Planctomycetes bacterium]|nr:hypothetical protein [Planctomycetota bacterium]
MADFVTHVAVANLCGKATGDDRARAVLLVGTCLPDVLYKGLLYAAGSATWTAEPSHSPLPLVALCFGAAMLFEEAFRPRAFVALLSGCYLHVLVDLGKDYMGQGVILWAFPFSMHRIELGWYRPQHMTYMMAGSAVVIVLTELAFRRRAKVL